MKDSYPIFPMIETIFSGVKTLQSLWTRLEVLQLMKTEPMLEVSPQDQRSLLYHHWPFLCLVKMVFAIEHLQKVFLSDFKTIHQCYTKFIKFT